MEFVLKIVPALLLVSIIALVAYFVDITRKKVSCDKMSFREIMDLCDLPIVTFISNERKLNFLLDTGSSKSVIDKNIINGLKYEALNTACSIYGLDGKKQTVPIVGIPLYYKGKCYNEEFQVLDMSAPFNNLKTDFGVNLHGILSSTFFQKYRYILNFDELVAYSMV